jgi:glycosyltransferase involved in cell wall biosynthesis
MSSKPKFSIILPVYSGPYNNENHNRSKVVQRAVKSVACQQYPDWELIIVDDGCVDGVTPQILDMLAATDSKIKVIHKANEARAIARNAGMDAAEGEWLCWLDSDDEYSSHYLRAVDYATRDYPDFAVINFGSIVYHGDHRTTTRPVFRPAIEGDGHEWFRSGGLGAGSFVFKRELWKSDPKYRMPDEVNPYQFAASSRIDLRYSPDEPYIEDPEGAFSDGVYRHGLSLGNPWGDDYAQFFYLTRDNHSLPLDQLLYIQYVRSTEENYEHFGEIYDPEELRNDLAA